MNIVLRAPPICDLIDSAQQNLWRSGTAGEILYNCRKYGLNIGFRFMHGTDTCIASSADGGPTWLYRRTVQGLGYKPGRNAYWALENIGHEGVCRVYVSYGKDILQNDGCGRDQVAMDLAW